MVYHSLITIYKQMTCVLSRAPLDQICHLTVGNWEKQVHVGSLPDHESDVLSQYVMCLALARLLSIQYHHL